jgi:hypothetical protein
LGADVSQGVAPAGGGITETRAQEIAQLAAERAVREVLRSIGVDSNSMDALNDLRADLVYMRSRRKEDETRKNQFTRLFIDKVFSAIFGAIIAAGLYLWKVGQLKVGGG